MFISLQSKTKTKIMKTTIFYRETGYDRTSYLFFELIKETDKFYYLNAIGKFDNEFGVNPNRSNLIGSPFRVKKTNLSFVKWNGETLKENRNYTYTGI